MNAVETVRVNTLREYFVALGLFDRLAPKEMPRTSDFSSLRARQIVTYVEYERMAAQAEFQMWRKDRALLEAEIAVLRAERDLARAELQLEQVKAAR